MKATPKTLRAGLLILAALLLTASAGWAQGSQVEALYLSATGWVEPGETYPFKVEYAVDAALDGATASVVLSEHTVFVSATPAPAGGDGTAGNPLTWNFAAGASGKIIIYARALDLTEEPTMIWRDLSATATLEATLGGAVVEVFNSTTLGPKCTTLSTARYGVRPFPLVMVEYQDVSHCTGAGEPFPECTGNHTGEALDEAVNSRTSGASLWQLYNDMSFGQLQPVGEVGPTPQSPDEPWLATDGYPYKWSQLAPNGTCTGTTFAPENGNPGSPTDNPGGFAAVNANRVDNGWYKLPGTQGYYGSDASGHGLVGFVSGGLLLNIDDGCGPTGKIAYDAAAIADPDLDYNEFDTDRDGLVDFLNVAFAGDGGNGNVSATGINNIWPHKSDLQFYFTDDNGQRGYVSNDQLRNHVDELMYWTDASRSEMTTTNTGIPVYVRVGPYNVNPESAIEAMSVIAHEYGHSLGLPDFYSLGNRETFGSWELMASDHAQFMSVFPRQELGWIVPVEAEDGIHTLRESKIDTGEIRWKTPDGMDYTLTGDGIHNADALKVDLPKVLVIEEVPSGTSAWHSGSGNEFGCAPEAGHNLDVFLPDLANYGGAGNVELSFQSLYEIEWDWDFAFLLVSTDGVNWQALPSLEGTTLDGYNPNGWECYDRYGHGITGVSRQNASERNSLTNPNRAQNIYQDAEFMLDRFDLTPFAGEQLIVRFTYFTDPAVAKRGWFIDDIRVTADGAEVYASDFEQNEDERLFSSGWTRVSTSTGVDTDHAYFIEMRDRVGFDFDSRGQSDRGAPTWQPGVAILYTDENHGYGNTGVDNPPAQTIVDSVPDPGNDTPNLDDAAFVTDVGREIFNGCTHIDNYDNENGDHPEGLWKLPEGIRMTVDSIGGLSADGSATGFAAAQIVVDAAPDCSFLQEAPVIAFGAGHEDPDPNGSYELTWTRPDGAVGPDRLQEATVLEDLFFDDAEAGMGNWVVETYSDQCGTLPSDMVAWQPSTAKFESPALSFFTVAGETAYGSDCADFHSTMTLATPISVPASGGTALSFWDSIGGELDDQGVVEASTDGGANWSQLYQTAGPVFAQQTATFLAEPLGYRTVDLTEFAGSEVLLRFHYSVGASNYLAYASIGWWVDDVRVETANWYDLAEVDGTSYVRSGLTDGDYFYRVLTRYPGSPQNVDSPWSNVISTEVVRAANTDPVAADDSAETEVDTAVSVDVLANDSDPDGDPLEIASAQSPTDQGGTTSIDDGGTPGDPSDDRIVYTPAAGFTGTDTFVYTIDDGSGGSDSATVTVTVSGGGPVACGEIDDANSAVEYRTGWHRRDGGSNGGHHRRMGSHNTGNGNGSTPTARVVFEGVEITYFYAMSERGGAADVYIDGDLVDTVSYGDNQPGKENLTFGHSRTYSGLGSGSHELVVEHRYGAVYVDGFAFACEDESAGADPQAPQTGSQTSTSTASPSEGPAVERSVQTGPDDQHLSVVVEGSLVPLTVQLLDASGNVLAAGDSLMGGATSGVDADVAGAGTYTVRVLRDPASSEMLEISVARTYAR